MTPVRAWLVSAEVVIDGDTRVMLNLTLADPHDRIRDPDTASTEAVSIIDEFGWRVERIRQVRLR